MNATMSSSIEHASIVDEIQKVLDGNGAISTATKDRLLLIAMKELFKVIEGEGGVNERLKYLEKYKPHLQVIAWATALIAASILLSIVTGQVQIVFK